MRQRRINSILIAFIACVFAAQNLWAGNFLDFKEVEIGKSVSDFALTDLNGDSHQLSSYQGQVVMIHFWSSTCPFVVRYEERLQAIKRDYKDQNVVVLAINSNENETLKDIKMVAKKRQVNYPILIDPGNKIADQFGAITTPHIYILDQKGILAFEGAVDDQGWSETNPVSEKYTRLALDAVGAGKPAPFQTTETVGCTIKRKF
jgi:peroxiredoxin